jgi:hypothetical protein
MNSVVTQLKNLRVSEDFSCLSDEAKVKMFELEHKVLVYEIYLLLKEKGLIEDFSLEQLTSFVDFHSLLDVATINEIGHMNVMGYVMKISDCPASIMLGDLSSED